NSKAICSALETIINNLQSFDNADNCIDYITSLPSNINTFLIISSHQFIIPLIHQLPQIKVVYIFNMDHTNNNNNYLEHINRENVFNDKQVLLNTIKKDVKRFSKHFSTSMTFFDNRDQAITEKSIKNLSKESQYFMYMHLFIEILLHYPECAEAKSDFLSVCREHYSDNTRQIESIAKFEKEYTPDKAIQWYTRDCFLYRILNTALRRQHFDTIYKLRFIVDDNSSCANVD
ncbi:unnamed protein product, partial [Rotaria sp. Silwood1]